MRSSDTTLRLSVFPGAIAEPLAFCQAIIRLARGASMLALPALSER